MALVHMNIIKGTTRTVYRDTCSLMGSSKAMFIKMSLLVKPRSHSAGMAPVHPGEGQPVYRAEPGHFS